ncbi:MAG: carboxypeptidase regulatory-like domain-containing protein [Acidobacteriota bacterium]
MLIPFKERLLSTSRRLSYSLVICLAAILAGTWTTYAQVTGSATLRGTVKDPNGAVIAKANVSIVNDRTREERQASTNDEGNYVFGALTPGTYTVKVEAQGFKTNQQTNVVLNTSDTRGLDIVMEVGATSETVTVQAAGEQIQKETGAKENTITSKQIENLSIISRSSLELLRILPGVTAPNPDEAGQQAVGFNAGANANNQYHVNGLRGENNNVSIDGSRVIDIGANNGTIITANNDMVQEVKVQSSNYAAEHGSSGVQISATTKGGSSEFHGTLYDYIRNHKINANDRSNTINGVARPEESYQYPGGNVGGPVIFPGTNFNKNRDKLFFFYGLEIQRQKVDPGARFDVVPTEAERNGIFPGGLDVRNRIDPVGKALINLYPLPNFTDPNGGRNNYVSQALQPINRNQQTLRVDYNLTNDTKLYVRWAREFEDQDYARGLWWNPSAYELPSHVQGTNLGRSLAVNMTNVINPTMTNEVLFSFSKLKLDNDYRDPSKVTLEALGIPNFAGPFGKQSPYAPISLITSWSGQTSGDFWEPGGLPLFAHNSSLSVTDNLTKVYGAHTMKFGGLIERGGKIQNLQSNAETQLIFSQWGNGSTGNVFADILVGRPTQVAASTKVPIGDFVFWNYEAYAQDGWKVRPNLTIEYGLRAAFFPTNKEKNGLAVRFDPASYVQGAGVLINNDPTRPNGILQASRGEIPKGITDSPGVQWAPRLNFAWDIGSKGDTVVRGGAGLFYNRVQGNYQYYILNGSPPNTYGATFDSYAFGDLGGGRGLTYSTLPLINPFTQIGSIDVQTANPDSIEIPRIATMSLSVARKLPWNNLFEAGYVGTQARHLPQRRNINYVPLGRLLSGRVGNADLSDPVQRVAVAGQSGVLAQFRPFPAYNNITSFEYAATSSYHSLQMTLSHQTGQRLQYFATYTFSKALGTTGVNETGDLVDPIDTRGRSYGILPYDRTHIFNLSYNYLVPDIARSGFKNGFTNAVFNGWQMSGITTFQSGLPIRLRFEGDLFAAGTSLAFFGTDAFSNSGSSSGAVTPVYLGNPQVESGLKLGSRMLDLNALAIPSFGTTGPYVQPFYLRAPHRWNHDITFFKNFQLTERQKIQFRAGFFNIFNQAYPRFIQGDNSNSDINVRLITECNVKVNGVPNGTGGTTDNVCDPTKGFKFTQDTINNFGRVTNKHGHRVVEFALKYYF